MRHLIFFAACLAGTSSAWAESPIVRATIDRGSAALKRLQKPDGSWSQYPLGGTALAVLALLESGTPADDPAIVNAVRFVRESSTEVDKFHENYGAACAILMFDRLGDPADVPRIRDYATRIVRAQQADGGWSYFLTSPGERPPVPQESDNSNTQFAVLALWAARRHGVDVSAALTKSELRFRQTVEVLSQGVGWGYKSNSRSITGANTCAGLLGLAAAAGSNVERTLSTAPGEKKSAAKPVTLLQERGVQLAFAFVAREFLSEVNGTEADANGYLLWSVERVAMAYDLRWIAGVDWYELGARRLILTQKPEGHWAGPHDNEPETSFALLFLSRSNLMRDLTGLLKTGRKAELRGAASDLAVAPETEAERLARETASAADADWPRRVERLRDEPGVVYTEALALAVELAPEPRKKLARDALAVRLSRMSTATLRERLTDPWTEMRRAAAVAAAMKRERALLPDLIAGLDDRQPWVVRACGVALREITGRDFGPAPDATPEQRAAAVSAWKAWWAAQSRE